MASRLNQFFNDPGLGQGFSNLAALFKPPSGAEAYAYAKAKQTQEEVARAREGYAGLAGLFTPEQIALAKAAGADAYMKNAGGYALFRKSQEPGVTPDALGNAQMGAGQAFTNTAQGAREAQAAQTSRNNADNETKLQVALASPVAAGATRFLTPGMQKQYGLPSSQSGNINVAPGHSVFTAGPTGSQDPAQGAAVYTAPNKDPSVDQVKAAQLQKMIAANPSDPVVRAIVAGSIPTTNIQGPNGPVVSTTVDALGQTPATPQTASPKTAMAKTPDGKTTAVVQAPGGTWVDSQTKQPIPPNSTIFDVKAQDTLGGITHPTTANQTSANNRAAEVVRMRGVLDLYENLLKQNPGAVGLPGLIRGTAQNALQVVQDMARSFGTDVPQLNAAVADIQTGLRRVAPEIFDKSIPEAAFLQGTLAYGIARTENPSGEVSRQAYERALERIRGGYLSNTAGALANVGAARKVLDTETSAINALRNPGSVNLNPTTPAGAPAPATPPVAPERWERGPDRQLRRVQ